MNQLKDGMLDSQLNCGSLFNDVRRDPFDKECVLNYFEEYENKSNCNEAEKTVYNQLKAYRYGNEPWKNLNELANDFLNNSKYYLAYICLVKSLRLNTRQENVYNLIESLLSKIKPKYPPELRKNNCSISVLMATYNRGELIRDSIQSVLNQTFDNYELLIINDGGGDDVKSIVDSFNSNKIKYFKLPQNKGCTGVMNEGILAAEGEFIIQLDDDDVYYPKHLETLYNAAISNGVDCAFSNTRRVKGNVSEGRFKHTKEFSVIGPGFSKDRMIKEVCLTTISLLCRKELFKKVGLFCEEMNMSMDQDFWLRAAQVTEFLHVDEITSEYRISLGNSVTHDLLGACFYGNLICTYYEFYEGKIALIKYFLDNNMKEKGTEMYDEIKRKYSDYYKSVESIKELIDIARKYNDNKFISKLAKDYVYFDVKGCIREVFRGNSMPMLKGIIPRLPICIIRRMNTKIRNS